MRMESLGLLPSQPTHNKQQATFNVGNSFELATVVELLALRGYGVIGVGGPFFFQRVKKNDLLRQTCFFEIGACNPGEVALTSNLLNETLSQ